MEWWHVLLILFASLMFLLVIGTPVAFAFLAINVVGAFVFWNGALGWNQLILSVLDSINHFTILPVPLFILMGEIMFRSGIAGKQMDVLDSWMGRIPGRLSLMAVGGGALFATLTGSAMAGTAMLGKILVPDMEARGYKKAMTIGPILGSGGLAIMIPPSALGVLLAALANFSVGKFLIAILIPGLIMAALYAAYIVIRCQLQPELAPSYNRKKISLYSKLQATLIYVFPLTTIIFVVIGLIFLGIATPTESAALGTVVAFILAAMYRGLDWPIVQESLKSTLMTTVMMFVILTGSTAFSQLLAFTGASSGLIEFATAFSVSPVIIIILMQIVLLLLGTFMEPLSIMMLTVPIYFPIVEAFNLSPFWFGAIMLLNMQMASTSPPFGLGLFVMKGVAPKDTTIGDIYRAALPFLCCDAIAMAIMLAFPQTVLWLPKFMGE
ncbi:MAG: C4-dicarboxylate ABC transporter permease [Rhodospirillaceae bacterium]|nr:C4-dicarboxylate ABC transporter permease [Rhodospirillaceae bacterium]